MILNCQDQLAGLEPRALKALNIYRLDREDIDNPDRDPLAFQLVISLESLEQRHAGRYYCDTVILAGPDHLALPDFEPVISLVDNRGLGPARPYVEDAVICGR